MCFNNYCKAKFLCEVVKKSWKWLKMSKIITKLKFKSIKFRIFFFYLFTLSTLMKGAVTEAFRHLAINYLESKS